jgi:hypothetical protein
MLRSMNDFGTGTIAAVVGGLMLTLFLPHFDKALAKRKKLAAKKSK